MSIISALTGKDKALLAEELDRCREKLRRQAEEITRLQGKLASCKEQKRYLERRLAGIRKLAARTETGEAHVRHLQRVIRNGKELVPEGPEGG